MSALHRYTVSPHAHCCSPHTDMAYKDALNELSSVSKDRCRWEKKGMSRNENSRNAKREWVTGEEEKIIGNWKDG